MSWLSMDKSHFVSEYVVPGVAALCVLSLGLLGAGCGGNGGSSSTANSGTTTVTGSAGDGPIVGGTVTVKDANGVTVKTTPANPTSDQYANFSFTVPSGTALPLTITVSGGTDKVTGKAPDFPLVTAVTSLGAGNSVYANANPLSTLIIEAAKAKGGLDAANIKDATSKVLKSMGFGLKPGVDDPIGKPVTTSNIAKIVKANEAVAEMIRRTSAKAGLKVADAIMAIGQDLTDGYADGKVAAGAAKSMVSDKYAAHIIAQLGKVSAEVLANALDVTDLKGNSRGVNFASALNSAIKKIEPKFTGDVRTVAPTQEMLDAARQALATAKQLAPTADQAQFDKLLGAVNGFTVGKAPSSDQYARVKALVQQAAAAFGNAISNVGKGTNIAAALKIIRAAAQGKTPTPPKKPTITTKGVTTASNALPTISGTAAADVYVAVNIDGYALGVVSATGGKWSLTKAFTMKDGVRNVYAVAVDRYGQSSAPAWISFTVDTVALKPTITAPTKDSYTNSKKPTVSGKAEPGASVDIYSTDGTTRLAATVTADATTGAWSTSVSTALSDGSYTLHVKQTDKLGNISKAATVVFTVDTVAPNAPVITSPTPNATLTTSTPTVSGTAEAYATIDLYAQSNIHWKGFATADANGNWSATTNKITNGTATFDAYAIDRAGNVSVSSSSIPVTISATTGGATISGAVIDGKVRSAVLTVYSDKAMTKQVGGGTTDGKGAFKLTLNVTTVPDPIYIKSTGGIDIETGLAAPTMRFVANTAGTNKVTSFNVTPLTDDVMDRVEKGDALAIAQNGAKSALNISALTGNGGLYDDPTATGNTALRKAAFKKLTSGTTGGTLVAGKYHMFAIIADASRVTNTVTVKTIGNLVDPYLKVGNQVDPLFVDALIQVDVYGNITGKDPRNKTVVISGKIVGSSMMFDSYEQSSGWLTRVVGNIGLNGSVAGNFNALPTPNKGATTQPSVGSGVFVGSLIPESGVNATGLASFLKSFYSPGATSGLMNIVARDLYSGLGVPRVTWGRAAVLSVDVANGTATMSNMDVYTDAGSKMDTAKGTSGRFKFTFKAGKYVKSSAGIPTNLLVFHYTLPVQISTNNTVNYNIFIATSVGLRRGIYFTADNNGKIVAIGESYMSKVDSLAPSGFKSGATHYVTVANLHPGMPGNSRLKALKEGLYPVNVGQQMTGTNPNSLTVSGTAQTMAIPASLDTSNGFVDTTGGAPELNVFQGSILVMKQDANDKFDGNFVNLGADSKDDHLRVLEFFESGAMQGEEVGGGSITVGGKSVPMVKIPQNFIGFVHKKGVTAPSFSGKLHLLARTMYAKDYSAFRNSYVTGTITITAPTTTAGTATLVATAGGQTTSTTATLTVDVPATTAPGVYHMHGKLSSTEYIDITWPIGGTKALWAISDNGNGNGNITEVGEAYITQ